jgi:3-deoxy-D-manno-octulosonic-acid transferase
VKWREAAWISGYNALLPLAIGGALALPAVRAKWVRRRRSGEHTVATAAARVAELRRDGRRVLLCHAASAGEFEQLRPLLRRLDRRRFIVVQTFFSPTIFEREAATPLADAACYHPLDWPWAALDLFDRIHPDDYLITRHDIWPNHLLAARRAGIRTVLINANLHVDSRRLRFPARGANRALFSLFDRVFTGSARLRRQLAQLLPEERIEVSGDTRFDQVWERARALREESQRSTILPPGLFSGKRVVVFGSTLESDDEVLFAGWRCRLAGGDAALDRENLRFIYVPHETEAATIGALEARFRALGISVCRHSRLQHHSGERVLLVDRVGILPELYAWGQVAYIGGGFGAGVHSVIEPAAHGAAVAFGPHSGILDEALDLQEGGIAHPVPGPEAVGSLLDLAADHEHSARLGQHARAYVESHVGASERIIRALFEVPPGAVASKAQVDDPPQPQPRSIG